MHKPISEKQNKFRFAWLLMVMLFMCFNANAQSIAVTGSVTDPKGEPLTGVTTIVKGSTTGTVTDINGKFGLLVHWDANDRGRSFGQNGHQCDPKGRCHIT